ncbi:hypothetical protein ABZV80_04025 [Streptomyces sp. NPDC005132]|uniref:hypothetical protein n=1 Tax=Streptomyces sp. NPDC005132 TaxID=3154294 RepID=UPI0033BB9123
MTTLVAAGSFRCRSRPAAGGRSYEARTAGFVVKRRGYRDLIHTADENVAIVPADPLLDTVKDGQFEISGLVKIGNDERVRGTFAVPPPPHRRRV